MCVSLIFGNRKNGLRNNRKNVYAIFMKCVKKLFGLVFKMGSKNPFFLY